MTDISDLERRMLECDKKCQEHEWTKEEIKELKNCSFHQKKQMEKVAGKMSWVLGLLFFVAILIGYCLNTMLGLNQSALSQASKNQTFKEAAIHVQELTTSQKSTEISIAQIQNDLRYMKRDLAEIRSMLKNRGMN